MKELATPTGDVYKNWDIREDEKNLFFIAVQRKRVYNRFR